MKTENMLNELAVRMGIKKFVLLLLAASILTNLMLGFVLATRKTIVQNTLTPPEIRRTMTVSNVAFSEEYLAEMAPYHVYLLLNNTPETVDYQTGQLLGATAPEYRSALEKELRVNGLWVKKNNVSTYYTPINASANTKNNSVKLTGMFEVKHADKIIERRSRELLVYYRNDNGTLRLLSIKEVHNPNDLNKRDIDKPQEAKVTVEEKSVVTRVQDFKGGESNEKP